MSTTFVALIKRNLGLIDWNDSVGRPESKHLYRILSNQNSGRAPKYLMPKSFRNVFLKPGAKIVPNNFHLVTHISLCICCCNM